MGNCFGLCEPGSGCGVAGVSAKDGKLVRVAKIDGKILEFRSPVLVQDVLASVPALGIAASKEASHSRCLSPDSELKPGRLYYLLGSMSSSPIVSFTGNTEQSCGTRRVKLVITMKQLQQLVSKQISLHDILSDVHDESFDLPSNWKPELDSIPEGNE